jgi:hypothetical protein
LIEFVLGHAIQLPFLVRTSISYDPAGFSICPPNW